MSDSWEERRLDLLERAHTHLEAKPKSKEALLVVKALTGEWTLQTLDECDYRLDRLDEY